MANNQRILENGDQVQLATTRKCCTWPCFLKFMTGIYLTAIVILAFFWSGFGVHVSIFWRQIGWFGFLPVCVCLFAFGGLATLITSDQDVKRRGYRLLMDHSTIVISLTFGIMAGDWFFIVISYLTTDTVIDWNGLLTQSGVRLGILACVWIGNLFLNIIHGGAIREGL